MSSKIRAASNDLYRQVKQLVITVNTSAITDQSVSNDLSL